MTIKQLVKCTAEQLEAMTDEQLLQHCAEYLKQSQVKPEEKDDEEPTEVNGTEKVVDLNDVSDRFHKKRAKSATTKKTKDEWMKEAMKLAQLHGVTIKLPPGLKQ